MNLQYNGRLLGYLLIGSPFALYSYAGHTQNLSGKERRIEEVIVTATKRAESERDVPMSIDGFSAENLKQIGATTAQDVILFSPGVSINAAYSPNLNNVQVRGTTTDTQFSVGSTPVGAFLDELPLATPSLGAGSPNIDGYDLSSVEVLKGPQGTLFGGAALAGAIRSIPNYATTEALQAGGFFSNAEIKHSDNMSEDYGVYLNLPVGKNIAGRAVKVRRKYGGVIDSIYDKIDDTDSYVVDSERISFVYFPSESLEIKGFYHKSDLEVDNVAFSTNPNELSYDNEGGLSPSIGKYRFYDLKATYGFESVDATLTLGRIEKIDDVIVQGDRLLAGQVPNVDIVLPQIFQSDSDVFDFRFVSSSPTYNSVSILNGWSWLLGFYRFESDQEIDASVISQITTPGVLDPVTNIIGMDTVQDVEAANINIGVISKEESIYFDLSRQLGYELDLSFGARLFSQEYKGKGENRIGGVPSGNNYLAGDDSGINPKIAITWNPTDDLMLIGLASKGFRFGGVNSAVDPDPSIPSQYESDELWNYEITIRTEWLNKKLIFDTTVFFIDWDRVQITQKTTSGISSFVENASSAESKGVEMALEALLPFDSTIKIATAYIDSMITKEFQSSDGFIERGQRLPGTPRLTGSVFLGNQLDLGFLKVLTNLTYTYQGEAFNNLAHDAIIPAYSLVGLNLTFAFPYIDGEPKLSFIGTNILDERSYSGVTPASNGVRDYFPIRPATYALKVEVDF